MHKIQKSIIIARTSRSGYSSMSVISANAICDTLSNFYQSVEVMNIASSTELNDIVDKNPDLVIAGFINIPDDESSMRGQLVWFSDFLESMGVCHTGSESHAMLLSLHKQLAKDQIVKHGLKTAAYIRIKALAGIEAKLTGLSFPLFVKPTSLGGGEGIDEGSVVHNIEQLKKQVTKLNDAGIDDVLVETYLTGKEYSVAILRKLDSKSMSAMPIEIITPPNSNGDRLLSLIVKNGNEERTSALSDPNTHTQIATFAAKVFESLGARDYGRIDIRCNELGDPHFLEANLIPSLIRDYGNFPKCCAINENMDYESVILTIVNLALERIPTNTTEPIAPVAN